MVLKKELGYKMELGSVKNLYLCKIRFSVCWNDYHGKHEEVKAIDLIGQN